MIKKILRIDLIITLILFILAIPSEHYELFSDLENQFVSARHILRNSYGDPAEQQFPMDKILIVTTDEDFFQEYESWPLRRADIGQLVTNLKKLGAKVIALDILMDFPSSYDEDPVIAEHLKNAGDVLVVSQAQFRNGHFKAMNYATPVIKDASLSGYSNHPPIGTMLSRLRLYPEIFEQTGELPFAVKAVSLYLGQPATLDHGVLTIGEQAFQLDHFNDLRIDFPVVPPGQRFITKYAGLSAIEILDLEDLDEDELEELKYFVDGKIVILGDTSEVSHDIFDTPAGEVYGVEVLADTMATLLKGAPLVSASLWAEILVGIIIFILLIYTALIQDPKLRSLAFMILLAGYLFFTSYAYVALDTVFSMSYLLSAVILGYTVINLYLYVQERKQKSFIKGAFSQYLSPQVIDIIVDDPSKLSLGGERKEMTAYFSDVQKFSTISESLEPEELVQLLNEYLTEMCDIISSHNGTIDKFEGDAIIAFWGAPLNQSNHAQLACFASIDMQNRLVEMRRQWKEEGKNQLLVRMGLNSGNMVVGNMGSEQRMDYTMMGDAVNLAARLEGANKFYGTFSMISEFTYDKVADVVDCRELDLVRVVGKNEPIRIYELLDRKNRVTGKQADLVDAYMNGLELYKQMKFADAVEAFNKAIKIHPKDGPSNTYMERCKRFMASPPDENWDGVFTHTEKG